MRDEKPLPGIAAAQLTRPQAVLLVALAERSQISTGAALRTLAIIGANAIFKDAAEFTEAWKAARRIDEHGLFIASQAPDESWRVDRILGEAGQ